jgi:hypothetical protein
MLRGTVVGDVWLVADPDTVTEHSDIANSGLPIFLFEEVEALRTKSTDELRAICEVKRLFPIAKVIQ